MGLFDTGVVRVIQVYNVVNDNYNNAHMGQAQQWADVEPVQGTYDFFGLDLSLQQIQEKGS